MSKVKEELYKQCQNFVSERYKSIQNTIQDIQESLNSETKSTAGDKHETGRAMLQLEREKAGNQLAEIEHLSQMLAKINISKSTKAISLGSVVYTSRHLYFIAISAGQLKVGDDCFYAISANSPIGQLLIGKEVGDKVSFRNESFEIINVL